MHHGKSHQKFCKKIPNQQCQVKQRMHRTVEHVKQELQCRTKIKYENVDLTADKLKNQTLKWKETPEQPSAIWMCTLGYQNPQLIRQQNF
jgi:hypothetical protein